MADDIDAYPRRIICLTEETTASTDIYARTLIDLKVRRNWFDV